jgi:carbon storage regulator CsrA
MLVLTRKPGELIEIGSDIRVVLTEISGNRARLGIEAPRHISVRRPNAKQKHAHVDRIETKPLQILVVDDSPEDRETYCRFMKADREHEYCFTESATGEEGLQWCRKETPDCVLLDYLLPDLSGLEFLAELSETVGPMPIPVVMLTGQGDEAIAVQAMKTGALDYLTKRELSGDRLCSAVHSAMQRANHGDRWTRCA